MSRWRAVVTYRSELGPIDVQHDIEELESLQDIVEWGPDWNTIEQIKVVLARKTSPGMRIEDQAT